MIYTVCTQALGTQYNSYARHLIRASNKTRGCSYNNIIIVYIKRLLNECRPSTILGTYFDSSLDTYSVALMWC